MYAIGHLYRGYIFQTWVSSIALLFTRSADRVNSCGSIRQLFISFVVQRTGCAWYLIVHIRTNRLSRHQPILCYEIQSTKNNGNSAQAQCLTWENFIIFPYAMTQQRKRAKEETINCSEHVLNVLLFGSCFSLHTTKQGLKRIQSFKRVHCKHKHLAPSFILLLFLPQWTTTT
jgi:hypothetical protein